MCKKCDKGMQAVLEHEDYGSTTVLVMKGFDFCDCRQGRFLRAKSNFLVRLSYIPQDIKWAIMHRLAWIFGTRNDKKQYWEWRGVRYYDAGAVPFEF